MEYMARTYNMDCFELMDNLKEEGQKIDLVLTDTPYDIKPSHNEYFGKIDLKTMWEKLQPISKENTTYLFFGIEPFNTHLRNSNIQEWKYDWYWLRSKMSGFAQAKHRPLKVIETISVFSKADMSYNSKNKMKYYPQDTITDEKGNISNYPINLLIYDNPTNKKHPTQKPVDLLMYLIETYTDEEATVLDFCMGSGSTGVACKYTNRKFIGCDKSRKYYEIARKRLEEE